MNNIDLMNYWFDSADNDFDTMKVLFKNKKEYMVLIFRTFSNRKNLERFIC